MVTVLERTPEAITGMLEESRHMLGDQSGAKIVPLDELEHRIDEHLDAQAAQAAQEDAASGDAPADSPLGQSDEALSPSTSGSYVDQLLMQLQNAELSCVELEAEVEEKKLDLKEAKSRLDSGVSRMRRLIGQIDEAKQKDAKDADRPLLNALEAGDAERNGHAHGDPLGDDSWKKVRIDDLGLSPAVLKSLHEAKIKTLGKLEKYRTGDEPLTCIPGVGEKSAEKIEEAVLQFFAARKAIEPSDGEPH